MSKFIANGFQSEAPAGWDDRSTITLVGPTTHGIASNIVVTRMPLSNGTTVADFAANQLEALAQEVVDLQIEDERKTERNGRPLVQRLHQFSSGEQTVKQVQTYLVHAYQTGTVGLVITGTSSPQGFDLAMPAFKQFVDAFDIIE